MAIALFGSGEFLPWAEPVDREMIRRSSRPEGRVVVVPTASAPEGDETFDHWGAMGLAHYARIGAEAVVLPLKTRPQASSEDLIGTLDGASLIFFSGGDPAYVCDVLCDTPLWDAVLDAHKAGVSLAGCSAGAVMMGSLAPRIREFMKGRAVMVDALNLFPNLLFGPHWDAVDGFRPGARAMIAGAVPAGHTFVGIDEDTAMVGEDSGGWRVVGAGGVEVITDGRSRRHAAGETFSL